MKTIEIKVPSLVPSIINNSEPTVVFDENRVVMIFDLPQKTITSKHAESMARFQKDVEERGQQWASDHWQGRTIGASTWVDNLGSDLSPTWKDTHEYRRVIKIGNRKVSEPVTKLNLDQEYWFADIYGIGRYWFADTQFDTHRLKSMVVRLSEQDAQELHEALLAVLAGE